MEIPADMKDEGLRFHACMSAIVALLIAADLLLAGLVHYSGAANVILSMPLALAFVASGAFPFIVLCREHYPKWSGRFIDLSSTAIWALAIWILIGRLVQIAARSPAPLVDATLAQIDSQVVQTITVVRWLHHFPWLYLSSQIAYHLLWPLAIIALFLPTLYGHTTDVRHYLLAGSISLLVTLSLFALWPAVGPWTVEPYAPVQFQMQVSTYLAAVKARVVPAGPELGEIVSFPSFHTVLAILASSALWRIRVLRVFIAGLCVAICVSTVTTGWHYVIDVIAGIVVAAVSHVLARLALRPSEATAGEHLSTQVNPSPVAIEEA